MKLANTILALSVAVLAFSITAVAQGEEAIDDVVVTGQKSPAVLRQEMIQAEEDFYALYNDFNDDNEYDVRCRYESPTGLRKKYRVCRPVFFSKARNREDLTRGVDPNSDPVIAEKMVTLQEKMETLTAANPELQVAMARYNSARSQLMAQSEE